MTVHLEPWSIDDLPLLERANAPEMTEHLGGPETPEQVRARHAKYLRLWDAGEARMFTIADGETKVGGIGWWNSEWDGAPAHETGWFVLPEHQGHGYAGVGLALVIDDVREHGTAHVLAANPSVGNGASNRVCERAGFRLVRTEDFPFRGTVLHTNVWVLEL